MPWAVAATVAGSLISSDASRKASNTQADAAKQAADISAQQRQPWVDAGSAALKRLSDGLAPGGEYSKKFTMADATNSSAEKHALETGMGSIQNLAAAKGGLLSTNALQETTKFAEDTAASYQNQAFNQWMAQQQMQLGAQQSLAQVGQTAVNQVADTNANAVLAAANAQAGNTIAQGNILGSALGSLGNIFTSNTGGGGGSLSNIFGGSGGGGSYIPNQGGGGTDFNLSGVRLSDERLKTNVVRVGYTDDGLPIYTYKLNGSPTTEMGVMAQDVEKTKPSAVKRHPTGFKMVDYAEVR